MIRHLENYTGDVDVVGDVHQIGFTLGDTYITSRAVEGVFPDYKQIIPKSFSTEMTLLKQDLADALKHVRVFSDQFNKLTVSISRAKKGCSIATTNPETGESVVSLDAAVTGDDLEMSFNYAYMLDGLSGVASDSVVLQFAGLGKPTCMRSVGDKSFLYIVMPMNR
jgi:DNA polymerase-3 subunit beta